jgi:hypothetical protein
MVKASPGSTNSKTKTETHKNRGSSFYLIVRTAINRNLLMLTRIEIAKKLLSFENIFKTL